MKERNLIYRIGIFLVISLFWMPRLLSQSCYEVLDSYSGDLSLYEGLDEIACEIKNYVTDGSNSSAFSIIGCDFYPSLSYTKEHESLSFDFSHERALEMAYLDYEGFMMITKEHHSDGNVKYRLNINYPNLPIFSNLNVIEKEAIENSVESVLEKSSHLPGPTAEKLALAKFLSLLKNGTNEDLLTEAGFVKISSTELMYEREGSKGQIGSVLDLCGGKIENNLINLFLSPEFSHMGFTTSSVLTDNSCSSAQFDAAKNFMLNADLGKDFHIWYHIDNEDNGEDEIVKNLYYKGVSTIGLDQIEIKLAEYINSVGVVSAKGDPDDSSNSRSGCFTPSVNWGENCLLPEVEENDYLTAMGVGSIDGMVSFIQTMWLGFEKAKENTFSLFEWIGDSFDKIKENVISMIIYGPPTIEEVWDKVSSSARALRDWAYNSYKKISDFVSSDFLEWGFTIYTYLTNPSLLLDKVLQVITHLMTAFNNFIAQGAKQVGYTIGKLLTEITLDIAKDVIIAAIASGAGLLNLFKKIAGYARKFIKGGSASYANEIAKKSDKVRNPKSDKEFTVCVGIKGCFVKNTPVLISNKRFNSERTNEDAIYLQVNESQSEWVAKTNQFSLRNATKAMAVAAAMPIVAVPIQEVKLLDYAVAHETVNSTYGLTTNNDKEIYLGLTDKDPYTSDQQRERDEYEINGTDWNEVVFEEVKGGSTAKLALHNIWINLKGYEVDAVVEMNLPEQGISGPFRITSIKHIIPQKKPTDDDEANDYDYRPVTALFTHESNQVYNINFDNGESFGITYQHPIYSTSAGDWRLAGELEIGEEVLTKSGNTKVISSTRKAGSETVYNLEVKEFHNFLIGESGMVVHNGCAETVMKLVFGAFKRKPQPGTQWVEFIEDSGKLSKGVEITQLEDLGSKLKKKMVGLEKSPIDGSFFPGIDGFIDGGNVLSLKTAVPGKEGKRLRELVNKADAVNSGSNANHAFLKDKLNRVDGMLTAKKSTKYHIKQRWADAVNNVNGFVNTDLIDTLYIQAEDGWMRWTNGKWTDL